MHHNGIRVVDYGYDFMFQDTLKSNKVNQLLYAGPEGLDGKIAPSKELDIYHFGLLVCQVLQNHYQLISFSIRFSYIVILILKFKKEMNKF